MSSFTITESTTFTITHARHMAAKVATDLKRMQRFYERPTDSQITNIETEVIELLKSGYLGTLTVGFKRNNEWIEPTLRYTARDLSGMATNDDDPGRVRPGADTLEASFYNYLTYSSAWDALTQAEKDAFKARMPYQRTGAQEPTVNGRMETDKNYSAGGKALSRASVRSYK
jgi:hypothetical protein